MQLHYSRIVQSIQHRPWKQQTMPTPSCLRSLPGVLQYRSLSNVPTASIMAKPNGQHPLAILKRLHPCHSRSATEHRKWMDVFREKIRASASMAATSANAQPTNGEPQSKRPYDSYVEVFLRFKSDPIVLEEYVNTNGTIRIGKILEDLDALAAAIAFLHVDSAKLDSLTVVTASVDRIDMLRSIPPNMDVKMSGFVTYVGSSSMEVSITMETSPDRAPAPGTEGYGYDAAVSFNQSSSEKILCAKFIMVALDPITGKSAKVGQLILENDQDRHRFMMGAEHKLAKKETNNIALSKVPPKFDEMLLIHDLHREHLKYLERGTTVKAPDNVIWMKDAVQESLTVCMPQDRNLHGKIFGGYLMRLAYELAYANSLIMAQSRLKFIALDDITFRLPVNIGSLLALRSQVVYSPGSPSKIFQVMVVADVIEPLTHKGRRTSNIFHFTFAAPDSASVPRVIPETYEESMKYIEGRRCRQRWVDHQHMLSFGISPILASSEHK
ncbi:hypothetical protein BASA50_007370 [Batrachochytrium salamandrivorans]|uniref:HotDog ACOT-type domain-containing protein n=1 Tax=Batrachochytrium salamandrivorans TaxID=1357716 RepID=A0ABQ8F783_9FUNG|nr:hypothetical protein BASA60_010411 [Batrachochytrium salamandrivorans]KAH6567329.1 hypothetical protein BASA62_006152 [Batrachochytrium salamandrivorans]KAH6593419.1 hypothetical protein BASA50_007370 [Batrachochytrium salamandrivorans]KAH9256756.1 hypothetical protein BASA81_005050 [Batrachochytrium salamandrivorans]KAH9269120.1 hypothetical protein BASA83_008871 [Batrachochytrium salamandrivorans]